jgi:hypothetical protein
MADRMTEGPIGSTQEPYITQETGQPMRVDQVCEHSFELTAMASGAVARF